MSGRRILTKQNQIIRFQFDRIHLSSNLPVLMDKQIPIRITDTMHVILYIEDEPVLHDLAEAYLEISGDLHLKLLNHQNLKFDANISDYDISELNGIELLKVLRVVVDKTAFILFTGKGREEMTVAGIRIRETGRKGTGAVFDTLVTPGGYRFRPLGIPLGDIGEPASFQLMNSDP